MKKVILLLVVLLLLGGGGGGAYYYFVMLPQKAAQKAATDKAPPATITPETAAAPAEKKEVFDYYVNVRKTAVYEAADKNAVVVDSLYKGEKVHALEKKNGFIRLTEFIVYQEGGEPKAEWTLMADLSETKPVIEAQERNEILDGYITKSDDLERYRDVFRHYTEVLINDGTCKPQDFEELGGWVRSVTYQNRAVYFIYCGGLRQQNKVYLDVDSGEIFYR